MEKQKEYFRSKSKRGRSFVSTVQSNLVAQNLNELSSHIEIPSLIVNNTLLMFIQDRSPYVNIKSMIDRTKQARADQQRNQRPNTSARTITVEKDSSNRISNFVKVTKSFSSILAHQKASQ